MNTIKPKDAANLSNDIYRIKNELDFEDLINLPEYRKFLGSVKKLSADVGTRSSFLLKRRDLFAVAARGSENYASDLFLIFRGTILSQASDLITDGRIGVNVSSTGSMVHSGFNETFESLKDEMASFIQKQTGINTVHCIGHSLGGAIANLAADWVSSKLGKVAKLYTFGAPRVGFGMLGFANRLPKALGENGIYRVYLSSDPVPMVPFFPYFHAAKVSQSYFQNIGGGVSKESHKMEKYIESVGDSSWEALHRIEPTFSPASIKRWLQQDNNESLENPTVGDRLNRSIIYIVQHVLSIVQAPIVAGLTIADYLAMLLQKGIDMAGEAADWVFLLVRKMMRLLGMKIVETLEELTHQVLRLVLDRVTRKIYAQAKKALNSLSS